MNQYLMLVLKNLSVHVKFNLTLRQNRLETETGGEMSHTFFFSDSFSAKSVLNEYGYYSPPQFNS